MQQDLWWAAGNNVIAVLLTTSGLYPFLLRPEVAALSMFGSTLTVASNTLMIERTKRTGIAWSNSAQTSQLRPTAVTA
jgi:Cu2+-exporting ATPase